MTDDKPLFGASQWSDVLATSYAKYIESSLAPNPVLRAWHQEQLAIWAAKPWHEKARINTRRWCGKHWSLFRFSIANRIYEYPDREDYLD